MSLLSFVDPSRVLDRIADRIRRFVERYEMVYLFASGGKDSTLVMLAASYLPENLRKRIAVVYTELVENTHPMNVEQVYEVTQRLLPEALDNVIVVEARVKNMVRAMTSGAEPPCFIHIKSWNHDYPSKTFLETLKMLGIGSVRASQARGPLSIRWCWLLFKHKWWLELKPCKGVRALMVGIKASDSIGRSRRWGSVDPENPVRVFDNRDGTHDHALAPIIDLTSHDVMALLRKYNIVLRTYELYGDALNCMFCHLKNREKIPRSVEAMPIDFAEKLYEALRSLKPNSEIVRQVLQRWLPELEKRLGIEHG